MATNDPVSDVLQSTNHSKLSAEAIAKALARHNRDHSATPPDKAAAKPKKGAKG